ncbi:MAG TPA: hypothetical protein VH914_02675 [Acidimicrobiia bacterium]|jgi:hypothetical protein|nr:hypothetical protein [Acidimicrobiia bacterium]
MASRPDDERFDAREKPPELLALGEVTAELFETLKEWFDVPSSVALDLAAVDSEKVVREMSEPSMVAALAMRKLQALHLLATPGVRTSTDVVVTIVQDLTRALLQAPVMRLRVAAERTDWDAALAGLTDAGDVAAPDDATDSDPETERFEVLHSALHIAAQAVIDLSEGEIVYLE